MDDVSLCLAQRALELSHPFGITRRSQSGGRASDEIFAAELDEFGLVRILAKHTLIPRHGFIGPAQLAVALSQPKKGGARQLALCVRGGNHRLVGFDGGRQIVVCLLLEQAALENGAEVFCGASRRGRSKQPEEQEEKRRRFHGVVVVGRAMPVVTVLQNRV